MAPRPLIAGNWKMNGLQAARGDARAVAKACRESPDLVAETLICPPATLVADLARDLEDGPVAVGGQDCHAAESGAHTGDVSAAMLADAGARYVIVGHSERRADHGEDDQTVRLKALAALRAGLAPIVCVGESEAQRVKALHLDAVEMQLDGSVPKEAGGRLVVAYEPVWAIGTGRTAGPEDIAEMHAFIRSRLASILGDSEARYARILYGGSVKPDNAAGILGLDGVDGALVGGASLDPAGFMKIIGSAVSS